MHRNSDGSAAGHAGISPFPGRCGRAVVTAVLWRALGGSRRLAGVLGRGSRRGRVSGSLALGDRAGCAGRACGRWLAAAVGRSGGLVRVCGPALGGRRSGSLHPAGATLAQNFSQIRALPLSPSRVQASPSKVLLTCRVSFICGAPVLGRNETGYFLLETETYFYSSEEK